MLRSKAGGGAVTLTSSTIDFSPCAPATARRADTPERALDGLYRTHARALRGFARRRVGREEAEDLVHDAYVRLLQLGETAKLEREYLFRIASNLAVDAARKIRVRSRYAAVDSEFCASAASPETIFESSMELRRFRVFLEELSPPCRETFLLNRISDLTHAEIADRMGVSIRTVERRMAKAQKRLHSRLGR